MNISSIVVKTSLHHLEEIISVFKDSNFCKYHLHDDKGRIIVTIEGEGVEEEINKLKKIQETPHVLSADMVYAYSENELNEERSKLENTDENLPEWLNDENANIEDIEYHGDLKGRF